MAKYRILAAGLLQVAFTLALPVEANGDRFAAASGLSCVASCSSECPGDSEFQGPDADPICSVVCSSAKVSVPTCVANSSAFGSPPWIVSGTGDSNGPGGCYGPGAGRGTGWANFISASFIILASPVLSPTAVGDVIDATGTRESASSFRVQGTSMRSGGATQELAVVRFTGNLTEIPGGVTHVSDLLLFGLIDLEDILFVAASEQIPSNFDFLIDVAGIPSSEIVLFVFGHGESQFIIPTLSQWGLLVFGLGLLMAMFWTIRRQGLKAPVRTSALLLLAAALVGVGVSYA